MALPAAAALAINVTTRGIAAASRGLEGLSGASTASASSAQAASKAFSVTSGAVVKLGAAAAAATTAMLAFTSAVAQSVRENDRLAKSAGLTAGEFSRLAFITETVGVNSEKLGDQFKDINDRLGEFTTVGTGAFQDVADVLGLTDEEAQSFAQTLQGLSGEDKIRALADAFDAQGVSAEAAVFATESLADELSAVIPLFRDGAQQANTLGSAFNEAAGKLALTVAQKDDLREFQEAFSLLGKTAGSASSQFAAAIAQIATPAIIAFTEILVDATMAVSSFFAQFQDPESIKSVAVLSEELRRVNAEIEALEGRRSSRSRTGNKARQEEIAALEERKAALQAQLDELQRQEAIARDTIPTITITRGAPASVEAFEEEAEKKKEIQDELMAYLERREQQRIANQLRATSNYLAAASSLLQTFGGESSEAFRINQALQIAQATINSYAAYTNALATIPGPAAPAVAASYLALGLAQVAAIASQSPPRAQGGQVQSNQPYLVGERGPELFMPNGNGTIVPNDRLGSGSGSMGLTIINQTTGRIDSAETSTGDDGRMILLIRETVKRDISNSNSDISKSLSRSTNVQRDRL